MLCDNPFWSVEHLCLAKAGTFTYRQVIGRNIYVSLAGLVAINLDSVPPPLLRAIQCPVTARQRLVNANVSCTHYVDADADGQRDGLIAVQHRGSRGTLLDAAGRMLRA